ncbi:hypothetical protein EBZ39_14250 [bacterium]|nr:hypothetical protein [bacterium]
MLGLFWWKHRPLNRRNILGRWICSGCGIKVKKELGERNHDCFACGLQLGRDLNAAKNILRVGMNSLDSNVLEAHSL